VRELKVVVLPIALDHVLVAASLPLHHKDPFDRVLVAQAHVDNLTLVTADQAIQQYGGALMRAT
jgi:PIN domain nuclease of toxin-antitoxin system